MTKIAKVGNGCTIDSMQIRVPLKDVESYAHSLTDTHYVVSSTGEVIETLEANRKHRVGDAGLSLQIKRLRHTGRENIDCLVIGAPSKILGRHYFDGITSDTFRIIYDAIKGSHLVNVSMDALFGAGIVTDFDIKQDMYLPGDINFSKYCYHLKTHSKPTTHIGRGCKVYNNAQHGQGIQFGTRKTATANYPFLKVYNKGLELQTKSLDFGRSHLQDVDTSRLIRTEVTCKNRQQFKAIVGAQVNNLTTVLSLPSNELRKFIEHAQRVHIDKITARPERTNTLTGMKLGVYNLMSLHLDAGGAFHKLERAYLKGREKKDRQRSKKLLHELHGIYLLGKETSLETSFEGLPLIGV